MCVWHSSIRLSMLISGHYEDPNWQGVGTLLFFYRYQSATRSLKNNYRGYRTFYNHKVEEWAAIIFTSTLNLNHTLGKFYDSGIQFLICKAIAKRSRTNRHFALPE